MSERPAGFTLVGVRQHIKFSKSVDDMVARMTAKMDEMSAAILKTGEALTKPSKATAQVGIRWPVGRGAASVGYPDGNATEAKPRPASSAP